MRNLVLMLCFIVMVGCTSEVNRVAELFCDCNDRSKTASEFHICTGDIEFDVSDWSEDEQNEFVEKIRECSHTHNATPTEVESDSVQEKSR